MAVCVRGWGRGSGTGIVAVDVAVPLRGFEGEEEGALRRKNLLTAVATVLRMATALVGVVVVALWRLV